MVPALLLIFAATLYRVCYAFAGAPAQWANFSPIAAILLCGAVYLPQRLALLLGAGAIVVADLLLNVHYHAPLIDTGMLSRYFTFGLILSLGLWVKTKHGNKLLFIQTIFHPSRARHTAATPPNVPTQINAGSYKYGNAGPFVRRRRN